jgi:hypothetical protein
MFGLVSGGQIYLKANATTVTCFEREQCERPLAVLGKRLGNFGCRGVDTITLGDRALSHRQRCQHEPSANVLFGGNGHAPADVTCLLQHFRGLVRKNMKISALPINGLDRKRKMTAQSVFQFPGN